MDKYYVFGRVIGSFVWAIIYALLAYLVCSLFSWDFNYSDWNLLSNIIKWIAIIFIVVNFIGTLVDAANIAQSSSIPSYDKKLIRRYYGLLADVLPIEVKCAIVFQFSKSVKLLEDNMCESKLVQDLRDVIAKALGVSVTDANSMYYTNWISGSGKDLDVLGQIRDDRNLVEVLFVHLHMVILAADGQNLGMSDFKDLTYKASAQRLLESQCEALRLTPLDAETILKKAYNK